MAALEAAAREDHASMLELARDLVQIPSRGGIDPYDPVPGASRVGGVMIGYPGPAHVVTGGRGVPRARLHVHGVAGHSGSSSSVSPSAIAKAAALVTRLYAAELPGPAGPGFPLPARLTAGRAEQEVLGAAGLVEPAAYVLLLRTGRLPVIETFGTPGRSPPYFYENFIGLLPHTSHS